MLSYRNLVFYMEGRIGLTFISDSCSYLESPEPQKGLGYASIFQTIHELLPGVGVIQDGAWSTRKANHAIRELSSILSLACGEGRASEGQSSHTANVSINRVYAV